MKKPKVAIGIDLGTSKCCVGVVRDVRVEILENERVNKTTPSYVAFTDTERLVGEDAKDQTTLNPANTVFGVKRILGRETTDLVLKETVEKMPYTVTSNDRHPCINVSYKDSEEVLLSQQISAMLLGKMKDLAELYLECQVDEAVISVPASFTNAQRQATKDAATIAGLKVLALISEPTAAAITYQANRRNSCEENIAIVDFGAGSLDVAVVGLGKRSISVKAVSGSTSIGGNEITEALMKHVADRFKKKHGKEMPKGSRMVERLRSCCEKLKHTLTLLPRVQERLDCFGDDFEFPLAISRENFNAMIPSDIQTSLKNCVDQVLKESSLAAKDISRVVLVGGSTRIPQFQMWLEDFFDKDSLDRSVNPDEAVAYGAAFYAALLAKDNELEDITVKDRVQNDFCFSIKGKSQLNKVFDLHLNNSLRVFLFDEQSPFNDKTRKETFEFYEELSGQKNPHRLIGTLCLDDEFRQAVRLITNVTCGIDRCGICNVVVELKPNHTFPDVLRNCTGKLSEEMVNSAIEKEQQFRKDDQDEKERVEAMSRLEALCLPLLSDVFGDKIKDLFPQLVKQIRDKARDNLVWLDITNMVLKAECVVRLTTLQKLKTELESQMKRFEQEECDRQIAVTHLKAYCSHIKASLDSVKTDETEMAAPLTQLLEQTNNWLKTSESLSKVDCDAIRGNVKIFHSELEKKLEVKRREDDRRVAIDDLHNYCSQIQGKKLEGKEFEFFQYRCRRLKEEAAKCSKYLDSSDVPSKAECDSRKRNLEKLVQELEKQMKLARARQQQYELQDAVSNLRSRCYDLERLANWFYSRNTEGHDLASLARTEASEIKQWACKQRTKEECNGKLEIIKNYLKTLNDIKENELKRVVVEK